MRILMVAMGLALLAGCVSPGDLEENEPTIQADTVKSPKQYALCVFPKWQVARTAASMAETEYGYRLWVAESNLTDELLDVRQTESGSSVVLKQRLAWAPGVGRGAMEQAVRTCL